MALTLQFKDAEQLNEINSKIKLFFGCTKKSLWKRCKPTENERIEKNKSRKPMMKATRSSYLTK
jgi:hypothetical protein